MSEEKIEKKEPLSVLRMIVAGIGILLMALSGGCTLFLGIPAFANGGLEPFGMLVAVAILGGIPFGIGFLLFRIATKPRSDGKTET